MFQRLRNPKQADIVILIVLIVATVALVAYLMNNQGARIGPEYQLIDGPITAADNGTPLTGTVTSINAGTDINATLVLGQLTINNVRPTATPEWTHAPGRPVGGGNTYLSVPGVGFAAQGGTSSIGAIGIYYPITVLDDMQIDQMGIEVTTASGTGGSVARMCIYERDQSMQPTGAPLVDSGTVATDTTGVKMATFTATTIPRGEYHMLLLSDATFSARTLDAHPGLAYQGLAIASPIRALTDFRYGFPASSEAVNGCAATPTAWGNVSVGANNHLYHVFVRISTP